MQMAFGLIGLAFMAWGCVAIIAAHYGIGLYPPYGWAVFVLHYTAPWVTLIGAFKLWKQARIWRKLHAARGEITWIIRKPGAGKIVFLRISPLERIGAFLMSLGGAALVYWLNLPGPEFLLIAALLVWFFKGFVFAILRRRGGQ